MNHRVVVKEPADILVILLYHLGTGNIKANMQMDTGVDGNTLGIM